MNEQRTAAGEWDGYIGDDSVSVLKVLQYLFHKNIWLAHEMGLRLAGMLFSQWRGVCAEFPVRKDCTATLRAPPAGK
jgi:hypothetical protein